MHAEFLNLVTSSTASHVAVSSGDWSDPATWAGGKVPSAGADVVIPMGVEVRYDVASNVELGYVRVDGGLHFATDVDTKMVVDTLYTTMHSHLTIGTEEQPVERGVSAEIVIADNGPIDLTKDPEQLSRGVVTMGRTEIQGAAKAPYLKLAEEPTAGATTLKLEGDVASWNVGDELVVMGTQYVGTDADGVLITQDEEVTIVAINPATGVVTLDRPLKYDHTTPEYEGREGLDNELSVYVGNSSRNVTISSENPEGVRGHVMFMHNADVEVRYAEFDELGRTDKSIPINTNEAWDEDDWSNHAGPGHQNGPGEEVIGEARNPGDENVEGRYALHIHRAGAAEDAQLAVLEGNAVTGSPGWGIVHHDSHAAVDYNFVYNVAGAGIVSEDANETGQWIGNFVTSTVGVGAGTGTGERANILVMEETGDFGIEGVAYESQSRAIIQQDNIAANSKTAWMFNTSETSTQGQDIDTIQFNPLGDPFRDVERLDEEDAAVVGFSGNQIIAVEEGIFTGHRMVDDQMDIQQQFFDITAWEVDNTAIVFFNYTGEYVVKDSLFVNVGRAVLAGDKTEGIILSNVHVENAFEVFSTRGYNTNGAFVDVTYVNVDRTLSGVGEGGVKINLADTILDGSDYEPVEITFTPDPDAQLTIQNGTTALNIKGELTDSLGSFNMASNLWYRQERLEKDGIQTTIGSKNLDFVLEKFGAIHNADGTWDLGFFWWVGDRMTGENQAVHIPLRLKGFDDAYLEQYEIDEFVAPSNEIILYYDGIQDISQTFYTGDNEANSGEGSNGSETTENQAPHAVDDGGYTVTLGETVDIAVADLLANDADADGDALSIVSVQGASGGSVELITMNGVQYIRFSTGVDMGSGSFTYTVSDGNGGIDTAQVTMTLAPPTPVEGEPTEEEHPVEEETGGTPGVLFEESFDVAPADADGVVSTNLIGEDGAAVARGEHNGVTVFSQVDTSGAEGVAAEIVIRAPMEGATFDQGGNYRDYFIVLASYDGGAPVEIDRLNYLRDEGAFVSPTTGQRIGDDFVTLRYELAEAGSVQLQLDAHVSGIDESFLIDEVRITAENAGEGSGGAPANTAPEAADDGAATTAGEAVSIDVLANDDDADGDAINVSGFGQGAHGTVSAGADGTLVYTPDAGFSGTDSFTYEISDGEGGASSAEVTVTVAPPPNQAPEAEDDGGYTVTLGESIDIAVADLLANDSDPDGDALSILSLGDSGSLSLFSLSASLVDTMELIEVNGEQIVRFTPTVEGVGGFAYTVSDGKGGTDTAYVTVAVETPPVQEEPTETGIGPIDFTSGAEGFVYADDLFRGTSQPSFASGEATDGLLRVTLGGENTNSTITDISGGWSTSFDSLAGQSGTLTLRFRLDLTFDFDAGEYAEVLIAIDGVEQSLLRIDATDSQTEALDSGFVDMVVDLGSLDAGSHTLTLGGWLNQRTRANEVATIEFDAVELDLSAPSDQTPNQAPDAADDEGFALSAGGTIDILASDLLANDTDGDGGVLEIVALSAALGGAAELVEVNGAEVIRFSADAVAGDGGFTYKVSDGQGGFDEAWVAIDIAQASGGGSGDGGTGGGARDLGVTTAEMFAPYAEWTLDNPTISGNAFDVDGKAIFTHVETGETIETGIFYKGDGEYAFRFSGVLSGEWTFETFSGDGDLTGWTGRVQVAEDPDARGFVVAEGTKFAQQMGDGSLKAILPNFAMASNNLEDYYENPGLIDEFIQTFIVEHGFTGLHIPNLGGQLFDIYSGTAHNGSRIDGSQGWNPDPRAFEALETLIAKTHEAGGVVHLWLWGDSARGQTPEQLPGGENGDVHLRMLEYVADRLGPVPGWTLGSGFDNDEWSSPEDAAEAAAFFDAQTDFDHLTSVRSEGPNSGTDHSDDTDWHAGQDIADYEHWQPDYEVYVAALEASHNGSLLDMPVMSGDRFRIREGSYDKDYTEEETVDGLWISTMAGGVANIWGNLINPETGKTDKEGLFGSFVYADATQEQISTWSTFFVEEGRFTLDAERANHLTGGVAAKQYALLSEATDQLIVYAEDTDKVTLNLSDLAGDADWAGGARITAVDTEGAYQEIDLGVAQLEDQVLHLSQTSDWALSITAL